MNRYPSFALKAEEMEVPPVSGRLELQVSAILLGLYPGELDPPPEICRWFLLVRPLMPRTAISPLEAWCWPRVRLDSAGFAEPRRQAMIAEDACRLEWSSKDECGAGCSARMLADSECAPLRSGMSVGGGGPGAG